MNEEEKQKIGMAVSFVRNMDNEEFREKTPLVFLLLSRSLSL